MGAAGEAIQPPGVDQARRGRDSARWRTVPSLSEVCSISRTIVKTVINGASSPGALPATLSSGRHARFSPTNKKARRSKLRVGAGDKKPVNVGHSCVVTRTMRCSEVYGTRQVRLQQVHGGSRAPGGTGRRPGRRYVRSGQDESALLAPGATMPAAGLAAQPHGGKAPGPQGDDPAARPARQRGAAVGGAVQVGQRHPPVLSERG